MLLPKKIWAAAAIFITMIAFIGLLKDEDPAAKIFNECKIDNLQDRQTCFTTKILAAIDKDPSQTDHIFTGLWQLAIQGKITDDPRIFSDTAHAAGMMLASKTIDASQAFSWCGKTFKQGCMHGFIMEHIDHEFPGDKEIPTLLKICDIFTEPLFKNNCIHGIGHELAAKIDKALPEVLPLCKSFSSDRAGKLACESGILMEYTKGTAGSGTHSDALVGSKELPCNNLPDEYKQVCFTSAGSYRQYNPGQEPFSTTYQFCATVPKPYIFGCMLGVSERALMATAGNAEHSRTFCDNLSTNERQTCLDSVSQTTLNL